MKIPVSEIVREIQKSVEVIIVVTSNQNMPQIYVICDFPSVSRKNVKTKQKKPSKIRV